MAHKYTYPVVDRALRNFLTFILVLMVVVGVGATFAGPVAAVDNEIDQDQTSVQYSYQEAAALAGYGDATIDQTNIQAFEQYSMIANVDEVNAGQLAVAI